MVYRHVLLWSSKNKLSAMKFLPFLLISFILKADIASSQYTYRIDTPSGPIEGTSKHILDTTVQVYLGIPYAEPPIGNQRFLKPKPVKPWTETLKADELPPACIQYTEYPFPWYDGLPGQSEDCLYLNVYAPVDAKEGSNLPVLFWIHGGGFVYGSNRMELYDASALALFGKVIVVTINYRLGVFGFLTSNTADAPGNVGMHDILMALKWVNNNIESFGGDKERITLDGESAGSMAVSLFCVSPLTRGLFSNAILQSGTTAMLTTKHSELNRDISQKIAKVAGCASDDRTIESDPESALHCLRSQNATYLAQVLWSLSPTATVYFWPQYGDDLFPSSTLDDIRNGNFHNVPILIGNTRDEGSFLVATFYPETFGFFGEKSAEINKTYASHMIQNFFGTFDDTEKYISYYLDSVPDDDYYAIRKQAYTAIGDSILVCPTLYFAESYAARKNDVYFYYFLHRPSNSVWAPWMGVGHYEEIQFVFGRPIRKPELYESNEVELSKKMIEIWSHFVKHGVPSDSLNWPKFSKENHEIFPLLTAAGEDLNEFESHLNNCNFLRDHFGF